MIRHLIITLVFFYFANVDCVAQTIWTNETGNNLWLDRANWSDGLPSRNVGAVLPTPIPNGQPVIRVTDDSVAGGITAFDEYTIEVDGGVFGLGSSGGITFKAPTVDSVFTIQIGENAALQSGPGTPFHCERSDDDWCSSGLIHITGEGRFWPSSDFDVGDGAAEVDMQVDAIIASDDGISDRTYISGVGLTGGTLLLTNSNNQFQLSVGGTTVLMTSESAGGVGPISFVGSIFRGAGVGAAPNVDELVLSRDLIGDVRFSGGGVIRHTGRIESRALIHNGCGTAVVTKPIEAEGFLRFYGTDCSQIHLDAGEPIEIDVGTSIRSGSVWFNEPTTISDDLVVESGQAIVNELLTSSGTIVSDGTIRLDDGRLVAEQIRIQSGKIVGSGRIDGQLEILQDAGMFVEGGDLTIGMAANPTDIRIDGRINVTQSNLHLDSNSIIRLGHTTRLEDATLSATKGIVLPAGSLTSGSGTISTKTHAEAGSEIIASGDLQLGSVDAFDGFFSDGSLSANAYTVTINDRNEAVLGSLTTLGTDDAPGLLSAPNGMLVEKGKNVVGFGRLRVEDGSIEKRWLHHRRLDPAANHVGGGRRRDGRF